MAALNIPIALMEMAIVATVSGLGSFINIRFVLIATELVMVAVVILLFRNSKILDIKGGESSEAIVENRPI